MKSIYIHNIIALHLAPAEINDKFQNISIMQRTITFTSNNFDKLYKLLFIFSSSLTILFALYVYEIGKFQWHNFY